MTDRHEREAEIAEAALGLLAEKGYGGMSMLAVAKRARASNETLYRWYGDKTGLFEVMIARDLGALAERLETVGDPPEAHTLARLGEVLLEGQLSPASIGLHRAAAADASDRLGATLAEGWYLLVYPVLLSAFSRLRSAGVIAVEPADALALWLDLLPGDRPLRCVTGAITIPSEFLHRARAARAQAAVLALCG